jgi:copper chaperone CopZ
MRQLVFHVEMTCGGCEKAVRAVLQKTKGVTNVVIDVPAKLVTVSGTATKEECIEAIKKTGKGVKAV